MKLLQQLQREIDEYEARYGCPDRLHATYPKWAFDLIWADVGPSHIQSPSNNSLQLFCRQGIITIEPTQDTYVSVHAQDRNGPLLKCFDPDQNTEGANIRIPFKKPCQHQWKTTHGLFNVYQDCTVCGARYEDVASA